MFSSKLPTLLEALQISEIFRLFGSNEAAYSFIRHEYVRDFSSRGRIEFLSSIFILPTLIALSYLTADALTAIVVFASCAPGFFMSYFLDFTATGKSWASTKTRRYITLSTMRDAANGVTVAFLCIFLVPKVGHPYAVILLCILAGCHLGLTLLWRGFIFSALVNITIIAAGIVLSLHINDAEAPPIFDILALAFYIGSFRLLLRAQSEDLRNRVVAYERTKLLNDQSNANQTLKEYSEQLRKQSEELSKLAWFDPLTGLANRRSIKHFTANHIVSDTGTRWMVAALDIDGFKAINDMVGHYAGDAALCAVADKLKKFCAAKSIHVSARLGGDEFLLICAVAEDMISLWNARLTELFKGQIRIPEHNLSFTVSIGIASANCGTDDNHEQLMQNADLALLEAKKLHGGSIVHFESTMLEDRLEERRLADELRMAFHENELELHFQPKIDMLNNTVNGFEALLRWKNSRAGWIAPPKIVKLAEENGLEETLARFVIANAIEFRKRLSGVHESFRVSFNLTPGNLINLDVAKVIQENLQRFGQPGSGLEVEVTEEIFLDATASMKQLQAIGDLGVSLAVDDFGAGFSSLSALRQVHFDVLKIDRAFAEGIDSDERAKTMFSVLAGIGERLGMEIVAEGIEYEEAARAAQSMGVRTAQGYHYSRPLPENEAIAYLEASLTPTATKLVAVS